MPKLMDDAILAGNPSSGSVPLQSPAGDLQVTLLWGGFTVRHETLITAIMEALGYRVQVVPTPTKADFHTGRELCNHGMCSPAYFTIGALINFLRRLRDEAGLSIEDITRDFAFVTAGSLGPCRFGMYESEYRLALKRSGFEGFHVIAFQQQGGLDQVEEELPVALNAQFAVSLLNGIVIGDVLNELANQLRPYEVVPGKVDQVFDTVLGILERAIRQRNRRKGKGHYLARLLPYLLPSQSRDMLVPIAAQCFDGFYVDILRRCAKLINEEIEVDFTRPKPLVKVTGEFWAQTTEGDGNYRMFAYLESQGAEVLAEPLMTWANYLCDSALCRLSDRRGLDAPQGIRGRWNISGHLCSGFRYWRSRLALKLVMKLLDRE